MICHSEPIIKEYSVDSVPQLITASADPGIVLHSWSIGTIIGMAIIFLILMITSMIAASEIAFFSLSPSELKLLETSKGSRYKQVFRLLQMPEQLLGTILIINNFLSISFVIITTFVIKSLVDYSASPLIGFLIEVVFITLMLLIFGEILPKIYASHHALAFTLFISGPLLFFTRLLKPFTRLLTGSTTWLSSRVGRHRKGISIHDLSEALELTSPSMSEERDILEGIVKFTDIDVGEIMKPRTDVVAMDIRTPFTELLPAVVESGYSRIPVYSKTIDDIRGILYIKDLLPHIRNNNTFRWQSLIRAPYYVPATKKINDLLREFQSNKIHMAVVIDEYGGTSGIVTLEDILEEIIGEIIDESDDAEDLQYTRTSDNTFLFDGKVSLNDFCKITDTSEDIFDDVRGEADTLAGLILELKGAFPEKNDVIHCKNFIFTIESVDKRRIKLIKVTVGQ